MIKEIFSTKENQFMLALVLVSLVLITFGFFFLFRDKDNDLGPRQIPNSEEEIVWKKFENKKFNFTVEYPEHFLVFEDYKTFGPVFNFYFYVKEESLPLTNLSEESHISIYPTGVPVGGDPNMTGIESEYKNKNNVEFNIKEYKTYRGKTWAIMATPKNTPKNWKEWGFIWVSSKIINPEFKCFDEKKQISADFCNPFEGDLFYKEGEVDDDIIKIGREFLDRINFQK
jgi:hypothetical protein